MSSHLISASARNGQNGKLLAGAAWIALIAASGPAQAGTYHATDEADESVLDIVEALSRNTTHKPDVRLMPLEEARTKLGAFADALAMDQVVRCPRARALGWTPSLRSIGGNAPRLLEEWRNGQKD